jgi:hypothetical protein
MCRVYLSNGELWLNHPLCLNEPAEQENSIRGPFCGVNLMAGGQSASCAARQDA